MKMGITSLRKQQQGMGHILVVVLILVVVGVVGFAGYTVANKGKKASTVTTTTTETSEQAAAKSSCEATYHDANLCHFASHADMDKIAYAATLTSTDTNGAVTTMTLESDGKGNTSLKGTGNGEQMNTVQLDGVGYIETDGVWYQYPTGDNSAKESDPASNMNLALGTGITYKPLGKEACGSLTCFKYSVAEAATPNATQYVWFDVNDYLLRQWKYTDATTGTVQMDISYPAVKITKPSPVKSFSDLTQ